MVIFFSGLSQSDDSIFVIQFFSSHENANLSRSYVVEQDFRDMSQSW